MICIDHRDRYDDKHEPLASVGPTGIKDFFNDSRVIFTVTSTSSTPHLTSN